MNILIACEFSGRVREAFRSRGHNAWSCDLRPAADNSRFHLQEDVRQHLHSGWDMMIAHPECTYLTNSGGKWLYVHGRKENGPDLSRWGEMERAAEFFNEVCNAPIPRKAVENPIMHCHARERVGGRATQYVQPWWFGSKKNKATGLRLLGLPKLVKTDVVGPMPKSVKKGTAEYRSWNECWYMSPTEDRSARRAITDVAVARAMAEQWG